ncbi:MAG: hypothetical protein RBG13Loki_3175 [Promethearchaeota archaeon CR_4]|nr:MAG: hypothetical protein RBG13Loki_3175 [Candidatus Lokiarchaeota archaeon CR_4]
MGELIVKQVKGTMVKRTAIYIKANKTGAYDTLLSDQAKVLLAERLVDPTWYSYDLYKERFNALCKVEARNDRHTIIQWGRTLGDDLLHTIYKATVSEFNVKTALFRYARFHRMIFNFGEVEGKIVSDHEVEVIYRDFEPNWDNFYHIVTGWVQ